MSKLDKLLEEILSLNKNLRFEELAKILIKLGYVQHQPKGGGSHYTFRKTECMPITIPKATPVKKIYVQMVKEAILQNGYEEV